MAEQSAPARPAGAVSEPQADAGFLAEASRLLADSLDYEATLATVGRLSLPYLGAWCIVDLCTAGEMRRAAVVHSDPAMQALARRLESGWPPERDDPFGAPRAVRTRQTEVIARVPDEMLVAVSRSEENLRVLRALGMGSLLVVPLRARGEILGAITYVSPADGRTHARRDVVLAEDLAARCAVALDNARLHREVAQARTRAEEALAAAERARAEAEAANEAKAVFLRTMSHELRTPLNAISAYVDILQMGLHGPLTAKQEEDLGRIQTSQQHLLSLVSQVLDYARVGAQRMEYDIRSVRLWEVAETVDAVIASLARAKEIALPPLRECPGAHHVVRADAEKLAQIVVNLLSNAVKFTPRGGRVELVCEERDGCVHIGVRDSGAGIAAADQERIFDPFVQLDGGLARTGQGTGLGLAISRDLARAMGGDLTVESTPGSGSTFVLVLPRGDVPARAPQA